MPINNPANSIYCDHVVVLADRHNLSVHSVSREVYDLFPGIGERHHAERQQPYWSKTIANGQIEVALFTFEPPAQSAPPA